MNGGRNGGDDEAQVVRRLLARERLTVDEAAPGRTCFLSHLGAQSRLVAGPWIAHREHLAALAVANLSHGQRTSLARAVAVEFDREFGVGRLTACAVPSGLPFGGASLRLRPRTQPLECLVAWKLAPSARPAGCDWLVLAADPGWCLDGAIPVLRPESLQLVAALGGDVLVLVDGIIAAKQVADACAGRVELAAHPRLVSHVDGLQAAASVILWPYDALGAASLRRREFVAVVCVDPSEGSRQSVQGWVRGRTAQLDPEITVVRCPGRIDRQGLCAFWKQCGQPRMLIRGDPGWAEAGQRWLHEIGAVALREGQATQLGLFMASSVSSSGPRARRGPT